MKIIIAGAGKIGRSVATILSEEGHDITVIDRDDGLIEQISNDLDVICIEGSATNAETLREAGADSADLLMAATQQDEVNMVCGISARKLGTKHVIARVRDPEYLSQSEFLREALGLSVIVNPEYECAKEISRMLRFPGAARVDAFSKGSAEIVEYRVPEESRLAGLQLKRLGQEFGAKVLVSVVEREGEASIPNGEFTLAAGDRLSITGSANELRQFFIRCGAYRRPVKRVMVMGGSRIAVYLARMLLVEEGLEGMDAFVALTGEDGDNIITSMYARSVGVGKIVAKVNREHFSDILENSGLDSIVTPKDLVAQQIARYVRAMNNSIGSSMETLYRLADGEVEAMEFRMETGSALIGVPLRNLKLRPNILIGAVIRGTHSIHPDGATVIQPGDHAVIVAHTGDVQGADSILEGTV